MAYDVIEETGMGPGIGTGKAIGGAIGLYAILGLALGFLGFVAAFSLRDVQLTAENVMAAISSLVVGILPFLAAPLLALGVGAWAGHATRSAGQGAIAGLVGGFLGPIVLFLLVAIGFSLGAAAAGVDPAAVEVPEGVTVPAGIQETLAELLSWAGFLYLVGNALIGLLSGALIGALLPQEPRPVGVEAAGRRPAGV